MSGNSHVIIVDGFYTKWCNLTGNGCRHGIILW